jgi:hypothetical protein
MLFVLKNQSIGKKFLKILKFVKIVANLIFSKIRDVSFYK